MRLQKILLTNHHQNWKMGEALVIEITDPGKVYYQTKNFRDWIK